jgi:hypothetical protein
VRTSYQDDVYGESEIDANSSVRIYVLKVVKEELAKLKEGKSHLDSTEPYYHVIVYMGGRREAETRFDLRRDELEKRILETLP